MNKVYILAPLICLLAFGGIYYNFSKGYEAEQAAKVAAVKKIREEEQKKEADARKQAVEDALKLQEQRKKEKAEKEEKDRLEKEARSVAIDNRDKSFRDQDKLSKQVDRLTKEVEAEKVAIAKVEDNKKASKDEEAFLRQYVKQAESNVKGLEDVLKKIADAEEARVRAAAAAAAAATKGKS